jgi:N,N'-diacetyllegionaminate synthase
MIIGNKNTDDKPLVVAEIGNNHEGNMDNAIRLVHEAADCGVDAVKFQTFDTEHYISRSDNARFERLKSFELTHDQFEKLSSLTHSLGLLFLSTPFDIESARFLEPLVDAYKIASGDNNFYPLIDVVLKTDKPLIISTGASDLNQVTRTVNYIENNWQQKKPVNLAILHCISCYPVPCDQINLQSIRVLSDKFKHTIGYSDHSMGIDSSLIAIAFGARIIEKHFTLNKSFSSFRDHQLSSEPQEMRELVQKVNYISSMLGKNEKVIQPCETDVSQAIRRSIVANRDLPDGHVITWPDITWIRPAGGIPPGEEKILLGKKLQTRKYFGDMILEDDVE